MHMNLDQAWTKFFFGIALIMNSSRARNFWKFETFQNFKINVSREGYGLRAGEATGMIWFGYRLLVLQFRRKTILNCGRILLLLPPQTRTAALYCTGSNCIDIDTMPLRPFRRLGHDDETIPRSIFSQIAVLSDISTYFTLVLSLLGNFWRFARFSFISILIPWQSFSFDLGRFCQKSCVLMGGREYIGFGLGGAPTSKRLQWDLILILLFEKLAWHSNSSDSIVI